MKVSFIVLLSLGLLTASNPVADKIVDFSMKHMGKKVARGECWDLASEALTAAGAKWNAPFDYGNKIDIKKQSLEPADILQFTNVKFKLPNGTMSFPQHTAIVYRSQKNKVTVFHQNFNNKRYVDTLTINLDYVASGKLEAFRPRSN